jgi:hypothetical protein
MNKVRYLVVVSTFFIGFQEYKLHGMLRLSTQKIHHSSNENVKLKKAVCIIDNKTNNMIIEQFLSPNKKNLSFKFFEQKKRQTERVLLLLALSDESIARDTKGKNITLKQKNLISKKGIDKLEEQMDKKLEKYLELAKNEPIEKTEARVLMMLALGENVQRNR